MQRGKPFTKFKCEKLLKRKACRNTTMFISTYPGTRLDLKSFSLYPADKLFSGSADCVARDLVLSAFWCAVAEQRVAAVPAVF